MYERELERHGAIRPTLLHPYSSEYEEMERGSSLLYACIWELGQRGYVEA
jgi:hypothetical protein